MQAGSGGRVRDGVGDTPPEASPAIFSLWSVVEVLWRRRYWIAAFTLLVTAVGALRAVLAVPVYQAEVLIAPKDSKGAGGGAGLLNQLGGLGGIVASQVGIGNTSLDRWEVLLKSRDLSESIIRENQLLPDLYPRHWDAGRKAWKAGAKEPPLDEAVEKLRNDHLRISPNHKKNLFTLAIDIHDPVLAHRLVNLYVDALSKRLRQDAQRDADTNITFLNDQMAKSPDPLMREKIQNLIALEIEKSMLSGAKTFDVLERAVIPKKRIKPKRRQIVVLSFFSGLMVACLAAVVLASLQRMPWRKEARPGTSG